MSQWYKHTQRETSPGVSPVSMAGRVSVTPDAPARSLMYQLNSVSWLVDSTGTAFKLQQTCNAFSSVLRLWCKMSEITIELKRNHWIVWSTTRCWPRHWWSWSLPIPPSPPSWSLQSTTPSRTVRPPRSWSDQWKVSWKAFINQEIRNKVNY